MGGTVRLETKSALAIDLGLALLLGLAFVLLAGGSLAQPAVPIMDEVHHAGSALGWLAGKPAAEVTHPPLAKHLMALGAWIAGVPRDGLGPAALAAMRAPAVVAGAIGVMATYGLGRVLAGRRAVGVFAALLLMVDGAWLVHARSAMTNTYAAAAIALGALGLVLALRRAQPAWLIAAGLGLGLAIASRWSALPALAIALAVQLAGGGRDRAALTWAAGALVLLPLAIYAASFVPLGLGPAEIWAAQGAMWAHHAAYQMPHPFQSPWWSWPLMAQPTWYDFRYDAATHTLRGVWAIGNAAVWWAAVPALAWVAWRAARARDWPLASVPALGLGLWLVWAVQPRAVTFMHYMLEAIPFACVAIALAAIALWDTRKPVARAAVVAYATLAVAWLAFFHPLLVARPVTPEAYTARMWYIEGWEFNTVVNRFRRNHGLEDPVKWRNWRESTGR